MQECIDILLNTTTSAHTLAFLISNSLIQLRIKRFFHRLTNFNKIQFNRCMNWTERLKTTIKFLRHQHHKITVEYNQSFDSLTRFNYTCTHPCKGMQRFHNEDGDERKDCFFTDDDAVCSASNTVPFLTYH